MSTVRQIIQALEEEQSLKVITQAYGELAGDKLKRIRQQIEVSRTFFEEVIDVYRHVKEIARKRNILTEIPKQGTAVVLLTSNSRFYGSIESEVIRFFATNSVANSDRFLVGRTAEDFFHQNRQKKDQLVIFKSDLPQSEELNQLIDKLAQYQKVLIYYPRFQSVLVQIPAVVNITQNDRLKQHSSDHPELDFIFEPEIDRIVKYFDTQIVNILVEQVFLEAELARTAARLISMEGAQSNAELLIKKERSNLNRAKRSVDNEALLETISALVTRRDLD